MNTDLIKHEVLTLDLDVVEPEQIGPVLYKLNALRELERELRKVLTGRMLDRIIAHGELTIDGVRWYAGTPKTYDVPDVPRLLAELLEACGGDLEVYFQTLARCFAAGWFKVSEIRTILGDERFGSLVNEVRKPKLMDGKPIKQLLSADPNFGGGR